MPALGGPAAHREARARETGFDRVATVYQALEYLAFGRALERARFCHVPHLRICQDVLVIGEGDGRFLARLLKAAPHARVRSIDGSQRMIARAKQRLSPADRERVCFECVDLRDLTFAPAAHDAIVTMFVLDCFPHHEATALAHRLAHSLRPGGVWAFADFAIPATGWRRWRAIVWTRTLYAFFRWQAALPPLEEILLGIGLRPSVAATFQHGLLRAVLYVKAPAPLAPGI